MRKKANTKKRKPYRTPPSGRKSKAIWLNILPDDKWVRVKRGITVHDALLDAGIELDGECGGMGTCGKCKIRVISAIGPPEEQEKEQLTAEELEAGVRLACRTRIRRSLVVHTDVDPSGMELFQILKHGQSKPVGRIDPLLEVHPATVPEPSLAHPGSDFFRLREALGPDYHDLKITPRCLSQLYRQLRGTEFSGKALVHRGCLLSWEPAESPTGRFGIVLDIGTTTLVGKLLDLTDGLEVSVISRLNSQSRFGSNVISRIQYVRDKKHGLKRLRELLLRDLNLILRRLMEANDLAPENVMVAVAAGNTTMAHFLLGIDPSGIAEAPFSPVITEGVAFRAEHLGLALHPDAMLYVMPSKSGYIGGDLIGFIMSSGAATAKRMVLGLDFGTNGEIFLGNRHRMLTCSAAAGPALEGARISRGMIARAGAIEGVRVENDRLVYRTIGNVKAKGLCGSGLVDLVAVLLHFGVVDPSGLLGPVRIQEEGELFTSRVVRQQGSGVYDFVVTGPEESHNGQRLLLTQKDIRELQLAKGAVAAGVATLMDRMGLSVEDLDAVYLAGALGNYVNPFSAMRIGLIPFIDANKIVSLGNAASAGATMALLSKAHWQQASEIVDHVEHVELSVQPEFYERFIDEMAFPEANIW